MRATGGGENAKAPGRAGVGGGCTLRDGSVSSLTGEEGAGAGPGAGRFGELLTTRRGGGEGTGTPKLFLGLAAADLGGDAAGMEGADLSSRALPPT